MRYAMIMAGGAGTRLWPMSRQSRPKQLIPFIQGRSLLELAAERLEGIIQSDRRFICTGEQFREPIKRAIPSFSDAQILGEPVGRDTVNAIGFTAAVLAKNDPEAIFAVLTADHIIEPQDEFARKLDVALQLVEDDTNRFVTFSITPTYPATGFGYVERGEAIPNFAEAYRAKRFVEKPDERTAQKYVDSGRFGWNSGMFVFHAQAFLNALKKYKPESHEGLMQIQQAWGTHGQQRVLNEVYPTLPKVSVDYAIMEPASRDEALRVCTVLLNINWMDVGSWTSYGETLKLDEYGNRTNANALHLDSRNVLAVTDDPNHTITTIGCDGLIVVRTRDATLVCRADQAQRVKDLAGMVDESLR